MGGDSNLYMGYYQGDCTHCHKLDAKTGKWSIPSAVEPPGDQGRPMTREERVAAVPGQSGFPA